MRRHTGEKPHKCTVSKEETAPGLYREAGAAQRTNSRMSAAFPELLSVRLLWRRDCHVCFVIQHNQMTKALREGIPWMIWPTSLSLKYKETPKGIIKQGSVYLII